MITLEEQLNFITEESARIISAAIQKHNGELIIWPKHEAYDDEQDELRTDFITVSHAMIVESELSGNQDALLLGLYQKPDGPEMMHAIDLDGCEMHLHISDLEIDTQVSLADYLNSLDK